MGASLSNTNKSVRILTPPASRLSENPVQRHPSDYEQYSRPIQSRMTIRSTKTHLEFFNPHGEESRNSKNRRPFSLWFVATTKRLQKLIFFIALIEIFQQFSTLDLDLVSSGRNLSLSPYGETPDLVQTPPRSVTLKPATSMSEGPLIWSSTLEQAWRPFDST